MLAQYIVNMADMCFGLSQDDICIVAYQIAEKCGKQNPFQNEIAG